MKTIIDGVERYLVNRGWNGLACDWPECSEEITLERTFDKNHLFGEAVFEGWYCSEEHQYCPLHYPHFEVD